MTTQQKVDLLKSEVSMSVIEEIEAADVSSKHKNDEELREEVITLILKASHLQIYHDCIIPLAARIVNYIKTGDES